MGSRRSSLHATHGIASRPGGTMEISRRSSEAASCAAERTPPDQRPQNGHRPGWGGGVLPPAFGHGFRKGTHRKGSARHRFGAWKQRFGGSRHRFGPSQARKRCLKEPFRCLQAHRRWVEDTVSVPRGTVSVGGACPEGTTEISRWSSEANTTGSTATKQQPSRMGRRKFCARIFPRPCRGA